MSRDPIIEPWRTFLLDLDAAVQESVVLVCLGGFAVTLHYGLVRPTGDIDVCEVVPRTAIPAILALGGVNSDLHRRHGVHLQMARVAQLPYQYDDRLSPAFAGAFQRLQLFVLDAYDLALSKIERNADQDVEDVKHLARAVPLDLDVLRDRYRAELRPYLGQPDREDLTLALWLEAIEEERGNV
jgi:hypothetical protein